MAQVQNAYKYGDSPTVYGSVNGQNYAFSNANDFTSLGGDFNQVQTRSGPTAPNDKNTPIYNASVLNQQPSLNPTIPNNNSAATTSNSIYQPGQTNGLGALTTGQKSLAQILGVAGPVGSTTNPVPPSIPQPLTGPNGDTYDQYGNPTNAAAQTQYAKSQNSSIPISTTAQNIQTASLPQNTNSNNLNGFSVGNTQQTQAPQDISANLPPNTTSSSSLGAGPTQADVMSAFQKNLDNQDQLISQLQNLGTVPQSEQDLQAKVAKDQANITGLNAQAAGLYNPDNQAIALPFLTGQAQNKLVSAQLQSTIDSALLNYAQGNRQFAFNSLKTVYDASRQNLLDTLQIYTQTAPQNLATNYNPSTGQVNAVMRNPLTGAQYTSDLGNIGAQHSFTSTNITTDPYSGALTFVGTTADGQVVTQPIGAGAGAFQGGSNSSGNVLQPSTGQLNSSPTGLTTPAAVNNNPGNLRNPDGSWQQFSSPQQGFQALMNDIQVKQTGQSKTGLNGNSSLLQFTSIYAPASDGNDPTGYATSLAKQLGVSTGTPIGQIPTASLAAAVAQHEDGRYWNALTTGTSGSSNVMSAVPPSLSRYVEKLNGITNSEYINTDRVPQTLSNAVKLVDPNTVPVLTSSEVGTVKSLSTTNENLEGMRKLANSILGNRGFGSISSSISNFFQSKIPQLTSDQVAQFKTFSDAAIKTIQGLASGATGLRINQTEIDTALNNMPTLYDSKESANAKLNQVESFLQNSLSQILPHAQLATTSTNAASQDYTSILNQLAMGGQ